MSPTTAIIVGAGHRALLYASYAQQHPDELEIVGVADPVAHRRATVADLYGLPPARCYATAEDLAAAPKFADVVINCVNVPNTEMGSILMCRDRGTIYFFSMATSFTKAALGAEGVGKDVTMIVGNGYAKNHAEIALGILRESPSIRALYEAIYVGNGEHK